MLLFIPVCVWLGSMLCMADKAPALWTLKYSIYKVYKPSKEEIQYLVNILQVGDVIDCGGAEGGDQHAEECIR